MYGVYRGLGFRGLGVYRLQGFIGLRGSGWFGGLGGLGV